MLIVAARACLPLPLTTPSIVALAPSKVMLMQRMRKMLAPLLSRCCSVVKMLTSNILPKKEIVAITVAIAVPRAIAHHAAWVEVCQKMQHR